MPYKAGRTLAGERASKLGHLEVLKSVLVNELVKSFERPEIDLPVVAAGWTHFPDPTAPLDLVFAVDGSWQPIVDERPPHQALAFVKTALMTIDSAALASIDKVTPHPYAIRDLMARSAAYHATALPLRHIRISGMTVYNAVRQAIYESVKDPSLQGEVMETLKWLAYEKWSPTPRNLPEFECPHCASLTTTLSTDAEVGRCPHCGCEVFITDMLGFHLEMAEEAASDSVATAYMNVHETLLLFTGIKHFWEKNREILNRCLFIKDGPLQLRAQYSKLVNPIRNFLSFAHEHGIVLNLIGQEKTGTFADHLNLISNGVPSESLFIPSHEYICENIQYRPTTGAPYGRDTNYGAKVLVVISDRSRLVLNVPVSGTMDSFIRRPETERLPCLSRVLTTLPSLLSSRHENALLPIELANSVASLSTYPSSQVLRLFADATIGKK